VQSRINIAWGRTRTTPLRNSGHPDSAGFKHVLEGHFDITKVGPNRSIFTISPNCYLLIYDRIFYLFSIITKSKNQDVLSTFANLNSTKQALF
jgi:hypothetical protein